MKIKDLRVFVAVNDLAGKVWNPKIRWLKKHSVLVEVERDDGACGLGECWCFARSPEPLVAFLRHEVAPRLVGQPAGDPAAVSLALMDSATLGARHGIMATAASGVDIALWDLAAREAGRPLWRLLGGADPAVAVYASGGLYGEHKTPEDLGRELAGLSNAGFTQVKMKVGALPPAEDEARVRAARAAIGPSCGLIVDGVYSFDRAGAAAFHRRIADCRIDAFQSPLPADDIAGMAALVAEGVPVMALEAEYRPLVIRTLLDRRAVTILQFALVACGGITAAREIVALAGEAGIPCSLEVSSTAVAEMAAFHFAAAHRQVASVEVHQVHRMLFDLFPATVAQVRDGRITLPETPGLGLDLPPERVERWA